MSVGISERIIARRRESSDLRVGGFVPLTTTDLPGALTAVVFCQGCPWSCRYCHNPHLIPSRAKQQISWVEIVEFMHRRVGLLDGIVFSGGEPTMQPALFAAVREAREMGFLVGLHTSGNYPSRLAQLLPMLAWVGMDIKAPPGAYERITRRREQLWRVETSVRLIVASGVAHQFRTTRHDRLTSEQDIAQIREWLAGYGAHDYVVQQFRSDGCIDRELNQRAINGPSSCPTVSSGSALTTCEG